MAELATLRSGVDFGIDICITNQITVQDSRQLFKENLEQPDWLRLVGIQFHQFRSSNHSFGLLGEDGVKDEIYGGGRVSSQGKESRHQLVPG